MKSLVIGTMLLGFAALGYSQNSDDCSKNEIALSEVEVSPMDQAYFDEVAEGVVSTKVYALERKASRYNVKKHPYFDDNDNKVYHVRFNKKKAKILATYDNDGKIVYAHETYEDLTLPPVVRNSVFKEHPDWKLNQTSYVVFYNGVDASKTYRVKLSKEKMKKNLKFDAYGNRIK
ncbi:hypothetical protein K8352_07075 [Flavobacteriaceae bacterium F89]|uniref:Nicotinate-nucleotide adenylyltransferase n=1 Tax=Cerina litoralis TaxID=2874477 RepID=A0AAE3EUI9_9FLAO|nr:hypothetical protein [Cerina litoralis]MCG2460504.1 hypothetical protein [Cerina litoralis]